MSQCCGWAFSQQNPSFSFISQIFSMPNQRLHQGLHFNAPMSSFSACQMLAQEEGIIHMNDAPPELPARRVEELSRQHQAHHRIARGRSSPSHSAPRDLGTTAERVTCKEGCQMSLYMLVHSTAILLLSRAN